MKNVNGNMSGVVRAFDVKKAKETRTIEFVASDETRDSYGTVVPADKWDLDRFNKNGVIGYQHNVYGDFCGNEDPDRVIGKGEARVEDKQLIVKITFEPAELNPLAEKIFQKILFGTLNAVSVGFQTTAKGHYGEGEEAQDGKHPTYYYGGQELLEVSVVNIPANKNALKRSLRSNTVDAIGFIYKALQGKVRYGEIEEMKVGDVLDLLEKRNEIGGKHKENGDEREEVSEKRKENSGKGEKDEQNANKLKAEKTEDTQTNEHISAALALAEASLMISDDIDN